MSFWHWRTELFHTTKAKHLMILTLTLKVRLIFIRMLWNIIIGFKLDCTQCINGDPYAVKDRNCTGVRNYVRNHINALKRKACAIDWGMLVSNYCIEKYCLKWKSLVTFVFIGLGGVKFSCEPASKPYRNRCPQRVGVKNCNLKFTQVSLCVFLFIYILFPKVVCFILL